MKNDRSLEIEKIFEEALDKKPEELGSFLDKACQGDSSMRTELESLLRAHEKAGQFMAKPASDVFPELQESFPTDAWKGKRIGPFQLVRIIGSGGMGTVYEAIQEQPHRKVALKLTGSGLLSPSALRRFQYEAEILGHLQHPGIAHVYEAGLHQEGSLSIPYIAMEFISGASSIMDHARDNHLDLSKRLDQFIRVCDAVHYGHQKGIIHRDLKPGNILVDHAGQVKVIDFGVARVDDPELKKETILTQAGQFVGTLQYMSPEQCGDCAMDIDIRSDVYTLGMLLYELITDRLPYDISDKSIADAIVVVREGVPRKPSGWNPTLRGDLETITLKALEKDRDRRYQSVMGLAQDLVRFTQQKPILARPPTTVYQIRMFAKRHKPLVLAIVFTFMILVGAAAVSTLFAFKAKRDRDAAIAAQAEEKDQREISEEIATFLNELLSSSRPDIALGRDLTVRQLLDEASDRIDSGSLKNPLVEAGVRSTIGLAYLALGVHDSAGVHLQDALDIRTKVLGPGHGDVAVSRTDLSHLQLTLGQLKEAEEGCRQALVLWDSLGIERHPNLANTFNILGMILAAGGRYHEAEEAYRQAIEIHNALEVVESPEGAEVNNNLGAVLFRMGEYKKAQAYHEKVLEYQLKTLKSPHPEIAHSQSNLGSDYYAQGDRRSAEKMWRQALETYRKVYPDNHPQLASILNNLSQVLGGEDQKEEALAMLQEALSIYRTHFGNLHPSVAASLNKLGWMMTDLGKFKDAESLITESLDINKQLFGEDHLQVAGSLFQIGFLYLKKEEFQRSEEALREALRIQKGKNPAGGLNMCPVLSALGLALTRGGKPDEAEPFLKEALEIRRNKLPPGSWLTANSASAYGECLVALKQFSEAEPLLLESYEIMNKDLGPAHERTLEALRRIIRMYEERQLPAKVAEYKALDPNHARTSEDADR